MCIACCSNATTKNHLLFRYHQALRACGSKLSLSGLLRCCNLNFKLINRHSEIKSSVMTLLFKLTCDDSMQILVDHCGASSVQRPRFRLSFDSSLGALRRSVLLISSASYLTCFYIWPDKLGSDDLSVSEKPDCDLYFV